MAGVKRVLHVVLFAAGALVLAPAASFAEGSLNPKDVCPMCYLVTDQITGYVVSGDGNNVTITPTSEAIAAGTEVPIGFRLAKREQLGEKIDIPYPTNLRDLLPAARWQKIDGNNLPPASPQSAGMDRQHRLTFTGPSTPGSLTTHPTINPVQALAAQGKPLAPNQVEWLQRQVAEKGAWVPGTLYVTMFLMPTEDGRWRVKHWNYLYAPNLDLALQGMPWPQCPAGSPGAWPKCDEPPPPNPCTGGQFYDQAAQKCRCVDGYVFDKQLGACVVDPEPGVSKIDPGIKVILTEPVKIINGPPPGR